MTHSKEIAKFFSGFETFHALMHGCLWGAGTELSVLGIHVAADWNLVGVFLNGAIAAALGLWAWRGVGRPG